MIGQIGVFMICAQAVVHFKPKEAYGKYLRLLLGMMVLVQIFAMVYGVFESEGGMSLTENIGKFQEEMEESMGEVAAGSALSGMQLEDMSLKMLQEILEQNEAALNGENVGRDTLKEGSNGAEGRAQKENNDIESSAQEDAIDTESTEAVGVRRDAAKEENGGGVAKVEIEIAPIEVGRGAP